LIFQYHPSLTARVTRLVAAERGFTEQLREQLAVSKEQEFLQGVVVRVAPDTARMRELSPEGHAYPEYAVGVAFPAYRVVLLSAAPLHPSQPHELGEVYRHELAHLALHEALGGRAIPRWFNEGWAIHASGESAASRTSALFTATLSGNVIPLRELEGRFPEGESDASLAYAEGADLVRHLLSDGQEHRFQALLLRVRDGARFEQALLDSYDLDLFNLESEWRESLAKRFTFLPVLFGGGAISALMFGLLLLSYRRQKQRAAVKLARWAREEAAEDARVALLRRLEAERAALAQATAAPGTVKVVVVAPQGVDVGAVLRGLAQSTEAGDAAGSPAGASAKEGTEEAAEGAESPEAPAQPSASERPERVVPLGPTVPVVPFNEIRGERHTLH